MDKRFADKKDKEDKFISRKALIFLIFSYPSYPLSPEMRTATPTKT